jgi:hypothetical protein
MRRLHTIDDIISPELLLAVAATWPRDDWPHWHRYRDQTADKFATKDADRIPPAAKLVIGELAKLPIRELLDVGPCFPDLDLHGAGLHMSQPGGYLGCHLDGATHPITGWSRVANAILFVDDWQPEWGGALQMVDGGQVVEECHPHRGRLAAFATSDTAWHQVSRVAGPVPRRTISLFWWSLSPAESTRDRAEFQDRLQPVGRQDRGIEVA